MATAIAGGTDNNQLKLAAKTRWQWQQQFIDDDKDDKDDDKDKHEEHDDDNNKDDKHNDKDDNVGGDVDIVAGIAKLGEQVAGNKKLE